MPRGEGDPLDSAGNLHANFKLDADGEYLALVAPDGHVLSEFGPGRTDFAPQLEDVSFGMLQARTLVSGDSPSRWLVPLDGNLGTRWTELGFDAGAQGFQEGTASVGYEDRPTDRTNFVGQFSTEVRSGSQGVYTVTEFQVSDASQVVALKLNLKYDNGLVAYLNGVRVAQANAPVDAGWFSTAPMARGATRMRSGGPSSISGSIRLC